MVKQIISENWGSSKIVTRGVIHEADKLPGFLAVADGRIIGLVTYHTDENSCEVITLNSFRENCGIGEALINQIRQKAHESGCKRLWLITTNDNIPAIRFYQKRGFKIAAIHEGAIEESRQLKPEIPLYGVDGIPIRDEIEMEIAICSV